MKNQKEETMQGKVAQSNNPQKDGNSLLTSQSGLDTKTNDSSLDDLLDFVKNQTQSFKNISAQGSAYISIVKSDNGTRFVINKATNEKLGYPNEIYIGYEGDHLMILNAEGLNINKLTVKQKKNKITIYNTKLVNDIINHFGINFSNITSKSFAEGYYDYKGRDVLYVKMV